MEPPVINDTIYNSDEIDKIRNYIIILRNAALEQTQFDHAVQLSVVIALLTTLGDAIAAAEPRDRYGEPA